MKLCNSECLPCCDYCIWAIHEEWDDASGKHIVGGPYACKLHSDQEHQEIAEQCAYCSDFHCFLAEKGKN